MEKVKLLFGVLCGLVLFGAVGAFVGGVLGHIGSDDESNSVTIPFGALVGGGWYLSVVVRHYLKKARGDEDLKDYYEEAGWKIPTDERRQRDNRTEAALTIITSMGLMSVFFALFAGWRGATLGAVIGALWGAYRLWTNVR